MLFDLHAHMNGPGSTCPDHSRPLQQSRGWFPSVAAEIQVDLIASFLKSSRAKDIFRSDDSCRSLEQALSFIAGVSSSSQFLSPGSGQCTVIHGLHSHLALAVQAGLSLNCTALVVNSYGNDQLVSSIPSLARSAQQIAQRLLNMGCDIGGWGQPYGEERRLLFRIAGAELVANATSGPPPPAPSPSAPVSAIIGSLLNVNVSLANVRNLPDGGVLRGRPVIRWNGTTASSICGELTFVYPEHKKWERGPLSLTGRLCAVRELCPSNPKPRHTCLPCLPAASLLPPASDDGFGDMHAAAVCKMLGYPGGGLAFSDAPFGFEPTQPALASLNCSAGQGPEGCLAYSIADGTCIPQVCTQQESLMHQPCCKTLAPPCCQRLHFTRTRIVLQPCKPCAMRAGVCRRRVLPSCKRNWWVTA